MTDDDSGLEGLEGQPTVSSPEVAAAKADIHLRCKTSGLAVEDVSSPGAETALRVGMRCGRETRQLQFSSGGRIVEFASIPFEKWVFLSGYEAICSYEEGLIEAAFRPFAIGYLPSIMVYGRLFGADSTGWTGLSKVMLVIEHPQKVFPNIEISQKSKIFETFGQRPSPPRLTLKLRGCNVARHDDAVALLKKIAGSLFFQIDQLTGVPLVLDKERRLPSGARRPRKKANLSTDIQYPRIEFDDAPLSLYWYARSASGMPLLQFLAFYQVIEFYFPIYSRAEAQRKLKAILKDPQFRGDRDADIAKLLSAIQISRSGAYGDERSQLRATILECVDPDSLRTFLESTPDRREFYLAKAKASPFHRVPLASPATDLRGDVAERIYDIRCKIVHTKNDGRDTDDELLLPFSAEAEQLSHDIELAQYLAQVLLIAGSLPFQISS